MALPKDWLQSGSFFRYKEKYDLFYKMDGKGEPILLLHGFPTSSWDWLKIWPTLIEKYQVIAPDFIGFGFSDKPTDYAYSLFDQADLVEVLMKKLNVPNVKIISHDYGDTVLQELLARQLDGSLSFKIQAAVLLNGGIYPETTRPVLIQKMLISPIGGLLRPFLSKRTLRRNFHNIFGKNTPPTEAEINTFYALMEHKNGKRIFHKLIRYIRERGQHRSRWAGALAHADVPLRLVIGEADPISGANIAARFAALVENADIVLLDGIGHYPQTETPERVLDAVLPFF